MWPWPQWARKACQALGTFIIRRLNRDSPFRPLITAPNTGIPFICLTVRICRLLCECISHVPRGRLARSRRINIIRHISQSHCGEVNVTLACSFSRRWLLRGARISNLVVVFVVACHCHNFTDLHARKCDNKNKIKHSPLPRNAFGRPFYEGEFRKRPRPLPSPWIFARKNAAI